MIRINMEIIKEVMWVVVGFVYTVKLLGDLKVCKWGLLTTKGTTTGKVPRRDPF